MKNIKTALENIIKKDKNYSNFTNFLGIVGVSLYFLSIMPTLIIIIQYFGDGFLGLIMAMIGLNTVIIGSIFLLYQIAILPFRVLSNLYKKGSTISNILQKEYSRIQNIEPILIQIQTLFKLLKKILFLRKIFGWILKKESNKALDLYFELIQIQTHNLLINLRSDLQFRLDEQQKTLESAKSEVENIIHGTTELNGISELQIARLNTQIEQFEELQRVLVKV